MTINAFVQARMNSRRLPGKVLKPILSRPMLSLLLERLRKCQHIDNIVILTSEEESDDEIADFCHTENVALFRGSLNNVLNRFTSALKKHPCKHVVRITADCPLIDHRIIDQVIQLHLNDKNDYTNNCDTPSFPHGLDTEIIKADVLQSIELQQLKPSDKEHVTLFVRTHNEQFKLGLLKNEIDYSAYRLTVDEKEDLSVVTAVFEALYNKDADFDYLQAIEFLDANPKLKLLNAKYERNEGLKYSLELEQSVST